MVHRWQSSTVWNAVYWLMTLWLSLRCVVEAVSCILCAFSAYSLPDSEYVPTPSSIDSESATPVAVSYSLISLIVCSWLLLTSVFVNENILSGRADLEEIWYKLWNYRISFEVFVRYCESMNGLIKHLLSQSIKWNTHLGSWFRKFWSTTWKWS